MKEYGNDKRIVIGVILIMIGLGWVVNNMNILPRGIERIIFSWQMLIIGIGSIVFLSNKNKTGGIIMMAIGGFFLLPRIFYLPFSMYNMFWPLVLVGVGVFLIVRWRGGGHSSCRHTIHSGSLDSDLIDEVAIFGGGEKQIHSKNFKGGKITAIFGGIELNLSEAELAEGVNELEVTYVFGGGTLIIPSDWNVKVEVVSVFGGFVDKRVYQPNYVVEPEKILIIKGAAVFGGGELKSYK